MSILKTKILKKDDVDDFDNNNSGADGMVYIHFAKK